MKHKDIRDEWLGEYQGMKKYIHQCVACQNRGYDPERIKDKEGKYFQEKIVKYFSPFSINEIGLCEACQKHIKV